MKKYLIISAGFLVSALVVACGGGGGGNNNGNNNTVIQCPVGTTFQNGYCINPTGGVVQTGSVGFYSENWHDRTLTVTNSSGMKNFLRYAMGVCDRGHSNGGVADCSAWVSGAFDIVMQTPNPQTNTLQVTFRAKPKYNPNSYYYYSLPSAGQLAGALFGFPIMDSNSSAVRNLHCYNGGKFL